MEVSELKDLSLKLMFKMKDSEYETLKTEFDTFLKWMDRINEIDGLENVEPMYFPYKNYDVLLREDKPVNSISKDEILLNASDVLNGQVSVPRVVEND